MRTALQGLEGAQEHHWDVASWRARIVTKWGYNGSMSRSAPRREDASASGSGSGAGSGRPRSGAATSRDRPILFKTSFRNTIYHVMRDRDGWKYTEADMEWDFHWAEREWMFEVFDHSASRAWTRVQRNRLTSPAPRAQRPRSPP